MYFESDELSRMLQSMTEHFVKEHSMTPDYLINELQGLERHVFSANFTAEKLPGKCIVCMSMKRKILHDQHFYRRYPRLR